MPQFLPITSTQQRIRVSLGERVFILENYFLPTIKKWILDIYDQDENPLIFGVCLQTGIDNLVKGKNILFENQAIKLYSSNGKPADTPDCLGVTHFVVYFGENDVKPTSFKDKMLDD